MKDSQNRDKQQNDLSIFTEAQLSAELERRTKAKHAVPPQIPNPDFSGLIKLVTESMKAFASDPYPDEDIAEYVFEEACMAIYGRKFFQDWYSEIVK